MSGENWGVSLTIQQKLRETAAESLKGQMLLQAGVTATLLYGHLLRQGGLLICLAPSNQRKGKWREAGQQREGGARETLHKPWRRQE